MSADFTAELTQARKEGIASLQALAEKHLPLVGMMVRRFPSEYASKEELYQQGVVGLMKALRGYDPSRETAFSTYAAALILGEMRMLKRLDAPLHIARTEAVLRRDIRLQTDRLTSALGREPTITELANALHMDAAELTLHLGDISVSSADAPSPGGTSMAELIPDPDDWQRRLELRDILSRMPELDQRLILLRHRAGLTQAEAGRRLGMTQMQVSRREKIIRTLLRRALAE